MSMCPQEDVDHSHNEYMAMKNELTALRSQVAELQRKLTAEQEAHSQLQSRCYDQGGTFSNVFDQCAEYKRQLYEYDRRIIGVGEVAINSVSRDAYNGAREDAAIWKKRALEAESKLDEAAKQEPMSLDAIYAAWYGAGVDVSGGDWTRFTSMLPKLYALPPNLPAMIEQAVREEREACAKECDDTVHSKPNWRGEGAEHCAAAIRARGEKI